MFARYIGIDYSGAESPESSLKGLRVYETGLLEEPREVLPPPSPRKYWTRRGLAEWLAETLPAGPPALVGIDHSFSFPIAYFERYQIGAGWTAFLEDFARHWPTDEHWNYVCFVRNGSCGNGVARTGDRRWRRITERLAGAKSVFHFGVPGSVATSTHAGLPWLLYLRRRLGKAAHFWPFDGWTAPEGRTVVAEAYPSLWRGNYPQADRTQDQQDAYTIARWMQEQDAAGRLPEYFDPEMDVVTRAIAKREGWILGLKP
jgi:hypothetical protein